MPKSEYRCCGHKRGQSMVEFSIIAASALMLIFGMMNCAIGVYDYNFVSYAAREATRYAAVRGSSSGSAASTTDISNFVIAQSKGLNGSKITVSTSWSPDNSPGSTVRVQVSYPFTVTIPFINGNTLNFSSTSQLIITQ
jgi:Flp pilus assembly protein TadG